MPVLFTFDFPPLIGGIQRYCAALAGELHDAGFELCVVAPDHALASEHDRSLAYPVIRFGSRSKVWRALTAARALIQAADRVSDHHIIAGSWKPAGLIAALTHLQRRHLTILAHGTELGLLGPGWRHALLRTVMSCSDLVVANSRYTEGLLRVMGVRCNIAVIPCGVGGRPIARRPARVPTILSVGRLIPRKGFDRVIQALPALRDRFRDIRYELVGDGPYRRALEAQARRLRVEDHVVFLGSLNDAALRDAYARAWCFAMPARAEGDDVEGFGIVYLEAALAGLAAVGGRASGAEDAIVDGVTGLLVDGEDAGDVARALTLLLGDPDRAAALGRAGRKRATEEFTWARVVCELSRLTGMEPGQRRCSA